MIPSDIKFLCPYCQQHLEAPQDMSGEAIECPKCKLRIVVPTVPCYSNKQPTKRIPRPVPPAPPSEQYKQKNEHQQKSSSNILGSILTTILSAVVLLFVMKVLIPVVLKEQPKRSSTINSDVNEVFDIAGPLLQKTTDQFIAITQTYKTELNAIDLSSILNGEKLNKNTYYKESKEKIAKAKAALDNYRKSSTDFIRSTRLEINALSISESDKQKALVGFDRALADTMPQLDNMWSLEKQSLDELENIVLLLANSKGWQADGKQILFEDETDLKKFNSILKNLQQIAQQQEQIKRTYRANSKQEFKDMRFNTKDEQIRFEFEQRKLRDKLQLTPL